MPRSAVARPCRKTESVDAGGAGRVRGALAALAALGLLAAAVPGARTPRSRPAARRPPARAAGRGARRRRAPPRSRRRRPRTSTARRRRGSGASPAAAPAAAAGAARPGSLVRIRGRNLGAADEVVFLGAAGDADDTSVAPRRVRRRSVVARVPRTAVERAARGRARGRHPLAGIRAAARASSRCRPTCRPAWSTPRSRAARSSSARAAPPSSPTSSAASRPASVQVELVRAADGTVVEHWAPARSSPASRRRCAGTAPSAARSSATGVYQFRVTATDRSGATRSSSAGAGRGRRPSSAGERPARAIHRDAASSAPGAPGAFTFLRYRFPLIGAHDYAESAARFGGGRGHQGQDVFAACGTPIVAARGGVVKFKRVPVRGRQLRRDRRRPDRRRLRLHAPARGGAGRARATACGPGSRSASSAPPAARAAATCTSRSGARPAGTAAAARSTRCPTCGPGTRSPRTSAGPSG